MIRVAICDTFPILRSGLTDILSEAHDITVIASCASGAEALHVVRSQDPDVLVTNLWLYQTSGMEVARALSEERRRTRVILVVERMHDVDTVKALHHGVRGIVTMEMPPLQMITCVRSVHAGHVWLDTPVAHRALERILRRNSTLESLATTLTPRELAIAQLVAEGLSNRDIANRMGIREGTVKLHLHHVYRKLGVGNRVALALHARDHALV